LYSKKKNLFYSPASHLCGVFNSYFSKVFKAFHLNSSDLDTPYPDLPPTRKLILCSKRDVHKQWQEAVQIFLSHSHLT